MKMKKILMIFILIGITCSISAVSAHDGMENPIVTVDDLQPGEEVSEDVNIKVTVHEHNEVKYVNFTAEHIETGVKYLDKQDSNPSDGWGVTWDTSSAPNGEYWFTATARDVKGLDGKAEMKLILNNIPKQSSIVLENSETVVDRSTNLVATLKDVDSNPLSDKNVEFIIDGKSYSVTTASTGVASLQFTPKEVKNYDIIVKFKGDNKNAMSQTTGVLKVMSNINATVITIEDVTGNHREKILLKANLQCPGLYDANHNKKIDFYVNGKYVGSGVTDENGDATLSYTVKETGGTYIYQAKYQNEKTENFTDYASLYVPQSEIYVTMSAVTYSSDGIFTVGNNFKLKFTVNNNGPDKGKNTEVKYIVPQSLKYIQSTSEIGKVIYDSNTREIMWNMGDAEVGSKNIEILFEVLSAGKISLSPSITTQTYDESIVNAVPTRFLTVTSYKLKSKSLTKFYGGSEKYRVYLYTNDGKAVAGANIKITVNKKVLSLKTNDQGFVELVVNLKAGSYNVKVTCNKLSVSNKIVVKPTLITKNISKKKSKIVKFTAKVLNTKGNPIKNKKVTFKVKGKKYKVKTNKKGIATLKLRNLKVGKYIVYTSYSKFSFKNTIRIKK